MTIAEYVARVVDAAPPLSTAQLDRLALLLAPAVRRLDRDKSAVAETATSREAA